MFVDKFKCFVIIFDIKLEKIVKRFINKFRFLLAFKVETFVGYFFAAKL